MTCVEATNRGYPDHTRRADFSFGTKMASPISDLLLNDRGFAFDPVGGDTFQLSVTGLRAVRLLQQGADEAAVLEHFLAGFEVDEHTARRDIGSFFRTLENLGWII